jgi:hypothetical protein
MVGVVMGKPEGKTSYMRFLEAARGKPIDEILIEAYDRLESEEAVAQEFCVTRFTLNSWRKRLGLRFKRLVVR